MYPVHGTLGARQDVAQIELRARAEGATVEWVPLNAAPTMFVPHLQQKTRIRRWRGNRSPFAEVDLTFGVVGDRWYVESAGEPRVWRFALASEAWAGCRRRMRDGTWARNTGRVRAERLTIEDDPVLPDGSPRGWRRHPGLR